MKLSVAGVGIGVGLGMILIGFGCSSANVQYASSLQRCIIEARQSDAGDAPARLAMYNACADSLDQDGGAK